MGPLDRLLPPRNRRLDLPVCVWGGGGAYERGTGPRHRESSLVPVGPWVAWDRLAEHFGKICTCILTVTYLGIPQEDPHSKVRLKLI